MATQKENRKGATKSAPDIPKGLEWQSPGLAAPAAYPGVEDESVNSPRPLPRPPKKTTTDHEAGNARLNAFALASL